MPKKRASDRASAATKAAPSSTTTSSTSGENGKTNALPIYRLKSFSDEKSVNHYSIKKHSSGAMLLEGHGKCTNKIPLSARNNKQFSSSLVSGENEDMDFIADVGGDELVHFYVSQLVAQNALREVSKIDDRFSMLRIIAVEEERNGFRIPKEQEKKMKMREMDDEFEEMLRGDSILSGELSKALFRQTFELAYGKKRAAELRKQSGGSVIDQLLGGLPKHLPAEFEAKSLAELEGLNTAFTPLKKNEFPSEASLDNLTLEGLGIEESDPITESAMKPNNGRRNGNEIMESKKILAKEQKKEREAVKKLKAEREKREKKQVKALGGSLIANLFSKSQDKKDNGSNNSINNNNEKKGHHQKDENDATTMPKLLSGSTKPTMKQEYGAAGAKKEKPLRCLSAYNHFVIQNQSRVATCMPGKSAIEIDKELGKIWRSMRETEKMPYFKKAAIDKARWNRLLGTKETLEEEEEEDETKEESNGYAPCEAPDEVEEEKETKMTERRELQKVRKEITATLRGIEDSFDLVLEDAEDLKVGAYENAEKFLGKLRALSLAMSRVI
ncbi:unnamed protein product [Bathycoccus prasinos]|jgi:hypothetical protein|tara:strand:- start:307 stop:1977 length:1671 start_codon:yes stop_codon:yes gene_type:complete